MSRIKNALVIAGAALLTMVAARPAFAQSTGLTITEGKVDAPKFYGLHFDLGIFDSTGVNAVGQNYYNAFSFYFEPSWDIGREFAALRRTPFKNMQLAARFIVTANVAGTDPSGFTGRTNASPQGTCSNLTPSANGGVIDPTQVQYCNPAAADRRADYSDFWLTLRVPGFYKIPKLGLNLNASLRFIFPASVQSRYATLATSITPFLGMGRAFWKGRFRFGFNFGVNKNIHMSETPKFQYAGTPDGTNTQGGNFRDGLVNAGISNFFADPTRQGSTGGVNNNFSLLSILSGGVQFSDKWSLDIFYIVSNAYAYDQPCTETINGVAINVCESGNAVAGASGSRLNRPARRDFHTLWASLGYQPLDWLGIGLSWINSAPMQNPDSTYRQGIYSFDYNGFTSINLGATISVDHLGDMLDQRRKKRQANPVAQSNAVSVQ